MGKHLMAGIPTLYLQAHDNDQPDTNNSLLHFSLPAQPLQPQLLSGPTTRHPQKPGALWTREGHQPYSGEPLASRTERGACLTSRTLWTTVKRHHHCGGKARLSQGRGLDEPVWEAPRGGLFPPAYPNHILPLQYGVL